MNPKVLVRPEVMLDILLTMLHLQFVVEEKKLNLQVYDRTNNQFTLEMYKENQKVIEKFAKSKATYKLKMLIFDIAHVIELIEKEAPKIPDVDVDVKDSDFEHTDDPTDDPLNDDGFDDLYNQTSLSIMWDDFNNIRDSSYTSQLLSRFF
ncbi:hypothetical protein GEMRC1_012451 [Eukaryota sp. GEM-RC1]